MKVLVVSTVERAAEAIHQELGDAVSEVKVVVPAVRQSRLQWLTNADDDAREHADAVSAEIADRLPQDAEASTAGDSDPLLAVEDALRTFAADEIVVVTHPDDEATWLEEGRGPEIARRLGNLPIRRLVVDDAGAVVQGQ